MSTHNIGFYEEISKIITELSSNIIKYAPYFFCWSSFFRNHLKLSQISRVDFAGHINLMSQLSKISDPASVKVSETLEQCFAFEILNL